MITFTRANNIVTIDFGGSKIFANPDLYVSSKPGSTKVFISKDFVSGNPVMSISCDVTLINGRPDDDPTNVSEWLKETFFYGFDYGTGGGGSWPVDYSTDTNQLTNIAKVTDVETAVNNAKASQDTNNTLISGFSGKSKSDMVTEAHDNKSIVYLTSGPAVGEIDYVSYKSGITEVARLTMGYDGNGNLISVTKS